MSNMSTAEDEINQRAEFLPMTGSYLSKGSDGSLPCLVVGGVQVYAYFEDGELVVSTNYDTPDDAVVHADGTVPTRFVAGGRDVWSGR